MAGKMGHQKGEAVYNHVTCPKCGKEMSFAIQYPKRISTWWCACGHEMMHCTARRAGLVRSCAK